MALQVLSQVCLNAHFPSQNAERLTALGNDRASDADAGPSWGDVAAPERAEARLTEGAEYFRQVSANIEEVLWLWDLSKRELLYLSPSYETLWGRNCAEVQASPGAWFDTVHGEDRDRVRDSALAHHATGRWEDEYRIVRPDGTIRWVHVRTSPVKNDSGEVYRIAGAARDVTKRKEAEEMLRMSRERLANQATMLSSVRDAVIARDNDQRIFYWNAGAERLYGWTRQEVYGRRADLLLNTRSDSCPSIEEVARKGEWRGDLRHRGKDGRKIVVESFCNLLTDETGAPSGILSINTDITLRKEAEQALGERERFAQASLDALGTHIAILDERGVIIAANRAWKEFARATEGDEENLREGTNYLDVCDSTHDENGKQAARVADGIRAVLRGETNGVLVEYACHSPTQQRWFLCRITRFGPDGPKRVVVAHENVTFVKQMQEQLRESTESFRSLARVAPSGIFRADEHGRVNYVNRHWCIMTGLSEDESLGDGWHLAIHPEDCERTVLEWNEAVRDNLPYRSEFRFLQNDGTVVWVIAEAARMVDMDGKATGYVGSVFNNTAQKQTEEVLRALSTKAGGLTDDAFFRFVSRRLAETLGLEFAFVGRVHGERPDSVEVLSIWAGDQFAPNFTYDPAGTPCEHIIGRELCIYPSDVQRQFPQAALLAQMGIASFAGIPLFDAAGESLGLLVVMSRRPMRDPQQVESVLNLFAVRTAAEIARQRAITALEDTAAELRKAKLAVEAERAQLVRRVAERTAELVDANAELARGSRHKSEFLANMSHELRTPLNAILGLSEAMLEQNGESLTPRQNRSVTTIFSSGQHLLTLINDILDLSKIDAGKFELHPEPVKVEEVCQSSLMFVRTQAMKKKIDVSLENQVGAGSITADPKRLKQILVNLLSNAVKFTPEGGRIGLTVSAPQAEGVVRFIVWDTGIGIAPEDSGRLFQAFAQIDSGLNRTQEGSGLGLALVAKLADLHGGTVTWESDPGRGSRFTVTLPSKLEEKVATDDPSRTPRNAPRAMLIDDEPEMYALLGRYLGDLGFRSILHGRGDEAVEAVLRERPDVVLLDINLPGKSGWEVLKQLRKHPQTHAIPVLIVSGVNEPERARALGAAGHLRKPFTEAEFAQFVQESLIRTAVPAASPAPAPAPIFTEGPLILLAEDNRANSEMMGGYLEDCGHRVTYAANGVEAVKLARECKPALILMDIHMPLMDGLTAIRELRTDASMKCTPIVALTGLAMNGDRERCLAAGADDYVSKPVSLRALVTQIRRHLKMPDME